jgi:hypothetical protein
VHHFLETPKGLGAAPELLEKLHPEVRLARAVEVASLRPLHAGAPPIDACPFSKEEGVDEDEGLDGLLVREEEVHRHRASVGEAHDASGAEALGREEAVNLLGRFECASRCAARAEAREVRDEDAVKALQGLELGCPDATVQGEVVQQHRRAARAHVDVREQSLGCHSPSAM